MNDAPRPACVPAGHIEPLLPAPPEGDRREPVADRLAEIEAWVAHPSPEPWNRGQVYADLRDLLAVAKAARGVLQAHDEADGEMDWTGPAVDTLLRAALANLEGGA